MPINARMTGMFFDSGGPDRDYGLNGFEEEVVTICPFTPGDAVSVEFQEFEVDTLLGTPANPTTPSCNGRLFIFDGDSTLAPLIPGGAQRKAFVLMSFKTFLIQSIWGLLNLLILQDV